MGLNIYFAAPLHDVEDREYNDKIIEELRREGHRVYAPHEHGVWEHVLQAKFNGDVTKCRRWFFEQDLRAMSKANVCVATMNRSKGPSEGMLWEMGWMTAAHKPVYLYNSNNWDYNLMPEFGSRYFTTLADLILELRDERFM